MYVISMGINFIGGLTDSNKLEELDSCPVKSDARVPQYKDARMYMYIYRPPNLRYDMKK